MPRSARALPIFAEQCALTECKHNSNVKAKITSVTYHDLCCLLYEAFDSAIPNIKASLVTIFEYWTKGIDTIHYTRLMLNLHSLNQNRYRRKLTIIYNRNNNNNGYH